MTDKNEVAIFEEIRKEMSVTDKFEYRVPISMVLGRGLCSKTESFGGKTLQENAERVDHALKAADELQSVWNRSHTQWTWRHLNLSYHNPWKNIRQISAELSAKKGAMNSAKWGQLKSEIKIKKIEEELASPDCTYWREVELKVKLAELKEGMAEGIVYIEGAMKDILALDNLYQQMKKQLSDFDEEDMEKSESKAHLSRSLVQCIRDVRQTGSITKGEQEYMEQIGVNPSKIQQLIRGYVEKEAQSENWDTRDLHEFVQVVVDDLIDNFKVDVNRMAMMGFEPNYMEGISHDKKIAKLEKIDLETDV